MEQLFSEFLFIGTLDVIYIYRERDREGARKRAYLRSILSTL